jgi:hypothetical protein
MLGWEIIDSNDLKDNETRYILTNKCRPPAEGNFCVKHEKSQNQSMLKTSKCIGYINIGNMAKNYSISQRTWKWTNKLFSHILNLTILNSCIILSSYSSKIDQRKFYLAVVRNLLDVSAREVHPQSSPRGRPNPKASQVTYHEAWCIEHWPTAGSCMHAVVCV